MVFNIDEKVVFASSIIEKPKAEVIKKSATVKKETYHETYY